MLTTAPALSPFAHCVNDHADLDLAADELCPCDHAAAAELQRIYATAPYGHATVTYSIIAGQPRGVARVIVVAIDGDMLTYTTDGVWISTTSNSQWGDWKLDRPAPSPAVVLARQHLAEYEQSVLDYRAEVAEHDRNGRSRSHCFHGSYLWVDYDVMCHGCETEGYLDEHSARAEVIVWALAEAHRQIRSEAERAAATRRAAHVMIRVMLDALRFIEQIPADERSPRDVAQIGLAWAVIGTERARYANN